MNVKYYKISHINGARLADELVIYDRGESTLTNAYGLEAVVSRGVIIKIGSNNNAVPEGGFVISGHGKGADIISKELCEGAKVTLDRERLRISAEIDAEAKLYSVKKSFDEIKARFDLLVGNKCAFDFENAFDLIKSAGNAIENNNADEAKKLLEEAYYLTAESKKGEIRAIWHRPLERSAAEVGMTVKRLKDAGFNLLLIETNYEGWSNAKKCVYDYLPLRPELQNADFDLIDEFIKAGKTYGVKIHAWVENFFFGVDGYGCKMLEIRPDLIARTKSGGVLVDGWDNFIFLNPALDEVHDLLIGEYRSLLENYDFDGIQLDYIRYPVIKDIEHSAGFEKKTKSMFKSETGINIDKIKSVDSPEWHKFNEWRAARVTAYVKKAVDMIAGFKAAGRDIKLSTAVFGNPDEAIRLKCQNWLYWTKQGWLDYIFPMAYLSDAGDVEKEIRHMVENYGEVPNVSGLSPMYGRLPVIESTKQVEACRRAGAAGVAFFETKALTDLQIDKLKKGVFRE